MDVVVLDLNFSQFWALNCIFRASRGFLLSSHRHLKFSVYLFLFFNMNVSIISSTGPNPAHLKFMVFIYFLFYFHWVVLIY